MNIPMRTDIWIYYLVIVLGLTGVTSTLAAIILAIMSQPLSGIFTILGLVAVAGLARLLVSPLNEGLVQ